MVSESEDMTGTMGGGLSQRILCQSQKIGQVLWGGTRGYGVRARGYDRCYGVEPEVQRIQCQSQRI